MCIRGIFNEQIQEIKVYFLLSFTFKRGIYFSDEFCQRTFSICLESSKIGISRTETEFRCLKHIFPSNTVFSQLMNLSTKRHVRDSNTSFKVKLYNFSKCKDQRGKCNLSEYQQLPRTSLKFILERLSSKTQGKHPLLSSQCQETGSKPVPSVAIHLSVGHFLDSDKLTTLARCQTFFFFIWKHFSSPKNDPSGVSVRHRQTEKNE